ncbi:uncharacterized protein G2W53_014223 [Senna tora]|uniref:Uncharacterized protein n=1 Tax=Senna tora TaxID=362788 RepID=A0A834WT56_9FABA|nr:uncharacterized protein G2W53_014223 [Senna tora]
MEQIPFCSPRFQLNRNMTKVHYKVCDEQRFTSSNHSTICPLLIHSHQEACRLSFDEEDAAESIEISSTSKRSSAKSSGGLSLSNDGFINVDMKMKKIKMKK